jgi:hypothetical protein
MAMPFRVIIHSVLTLAGLTGLTMALVWLLLGALAFGAVTR